MGVVEVRNSTYHMADKLKAHWDLIKDGGLEKIDEDRVYIVDGRERTGKSLFTIQQSAYIDPTVLDDEKNGITLPKIPIGNATSWQDDSEWRTEAIRRYNEGSLLPSITFSVDETLKFLRSTKSKKGETKVKIFDEAFRGLSSKGALSKENKKLVEAMMEMGQNNIVLWVVSPSFFLLELYPAMLRSHALFHIKKDKKSKKRVFQVFNYRKKALLYQIGIRKGWGYPIRTINKGNFYEIYPGGKDFEWRYRLKKWLSFNRPQNVEVLSNKEQKYMDQRDKILQGIYADFINSTRKLSDWLMSRGVELSYSAISNLLKLKNTDKIENC